VEVGDFGSADETRTPDKTRVEVVRMGGRLPGTMGLGIPDDVRGDGDHSLPLDYRSSAL
jgi:hypothetical protein